MHHQKRIQASERCTTIQKNDTSRRLYLEAWPLERCFSWSTSPSKCLQHDSRIKLKKSNLMWHDPKEVLTSLKSGWTIKQLFFHFYDISKGWEKKATSSLSSLRLMDQRCTRLKICKPQRIYSEVYIKLEIEEERVVEKNLLNIFLSIQSFQLPSFSILWTIRKLEFVTSIWKIFSKDL